MVYLVTSNTENLGVGVNTTGINDPSNYANMLNQTFEIEENSEVAVESIKITRNGNLQLSSANNQFGVYLGQELAQVVGERGEALENELGFVHRTEITGGNVTKAPADLTDNIREGLIKGLGQHPNFVSIDVNYPQVSLKNSSDTFQGFKYEFKQNLSGEKTHIPAVAGDWVATSVNNTNAVISASGSHGVVIQKPSAENLSGACSVIGQTYPINHANGSVVFMFDSDANGSAGAGDVGEAWWVGLTRATTNLFQDSSFHGVPDNYEEHSNIDFFDYFVNTDHPEGKLQAGYYGYADADSDPGDPLVYFEGYNPIVVSEKSIGSGPSAIHGIKFLIVGDVVKIYTLDDKLAETIWVDYTANKDTNLKPIGIDNFYMYPKVSMLTEPSASRVMVINGYDGLNIPTYDFQNKTNASFQYGGAFKTNNVNPNALLGTQLNLSKPTYQDFYRTNLIVNNANYGLTEQRKILDPDYNRVYTSQGLNASGGLNKKITIVSAPSSLYNGTGGLLGGGWTDGFGAQNILGFENLPPQSAGTYVGVTEGNLATLESKTTPKMVSNKSLFVRLPDLPIQSFNTGKSSTSKILYHLPRFDNSGNEVGGLFFQPAERLYIPLRNPNKIRLNNIRVELCNIDETNNNVDLVGQTIICFDIRKARI